MEQKDKKNDSTQFLKDAYTKLKSKQKSGELSMYIMAIVQVYNLVFFQADPGYTIYIYAPIAIMIGIYMSKYWITDESWKYRSGVIALFIVQLYDLFLSLSFLPKSNATTDDIWNYFDDHSWTAYPTIIFDITSLILLVQWLRNRSK